MKFAVVKGMIQFYTRKYLGEQGYAFIGRPVEVVTDLIYNKMNQMNYFLYLSQALYSTLDIELNFV